MDSNFNIDGNTFISAMIEAGLRRSGDTKTLRLKKIFDKHNIPLLEGMAMMAEIMVALGGEENDGRTD